LESVPQAICQLLSQKAPPLFCGGEIGLSPNKAVNPERLTPESEIRRMLGNTVNHFKKRRLAMLPRGPRRPLEDAKACPERIRRGVEPATAEPRMTGTKSGEYRINPAGIERQPIYIEDILSQQRSQYEAKTKEIRERQSRPERRKNNATTARHTSTKRLAEPTA
jgi:hypothetical protein